MNQWIETLSPAPANTQETPNHYQPIAICETYQTDNAELLAPATSATDEMAIDALYQSL